MSALHSITPELMTVGQVARCLAISERTVWRWTAQGVLPEPVRPSRRSTRWRSLDIRQFLDSLCPQNGGTMPEQTNPAGESYDV
jgi:excisionase family DNA binding protein